MKRRADAERNYWALLDAAETVFSEHGEQAPLQLVAQEAGVGRATLYRNFSDRASLVAEIYDRRLTRYADFVANHHDDPDVIMRLLREVSRDQRALPGLFRIIEKDLSTSERVQSLWQRTREVFGKPLRLAKEQGTVRADLEVEDLLVTIAMLLGAATSPSARVDPVAATERALRLVERSLRP